VYLSYFNYFSQRDYSFINISSTKQPVWATKESLFLSLIKRLCIANAQTYTCGGHIRAWAPEGERAQVCLGVQRSQSSARHSISCAHIGDIGTRVRHRSHVRTCQWCARTQAHSRALHGACAAHGVEIISALKQHDSQAAALRSNIARSITHCNEKWTALPFQVFGRYVAILGTVPK
jgi:hypothetical protein